MSDRLIEEARRAASTFARPVEASLMFGLIERLESQTPLPDEMRWCVTHRWLRTVDGGDPCEDLEEGDVCDLRILAALPREADTDAATYYDELAGEADDEEPDWLALALSERDRWKARAEAAEARIAAAKLVCADPSSPFSMAPGTVFAADVLAALTRKAADASKRTPRQRWGTCCPFDHDCEHVFIDDIERHMDTPISDEEAAALTGEAATMPNEPWTSDPGPTPPSELPRQAQRALAIANYFGDVTPHDRLAVLTEEVGEVARCIVKRRHGLRPEVDWNAELRHEIGDVMVALLALAAAEGIDADEEASIRMDALDVRIRAALTEGGRR